MTKGNFRSEISSPQSDYHYMSCLKHFAGYGALNAAEYNDVKISQRTFPETLSQKPFHYVVIHADQKAMMIISFSYS